MTASEETCGPRKKQTNKPNPGWQVSKQGKTDTKQTNKQTNKKQSKMQGDPHVINIGVIISTPALNILG